MNQALPRVTYSNIGADFTKVHAVLTERLAAVSAGLGQFHPNRISGREQDGPEHYAAASPIDRRITLGQFVRTGAEGVDAAVAAARSGKLVHHEHRYGDIGRAQVRQASVVRAISLLREVADGEDFPN